MSVFFEKQIEANFFEKGKIFAVFARNAKKAETFANNCENLVTVEYEHTLIFFMFLLQSKYLRRHFLNPFLSEIVLCATVSFVHCSSTIKNVFLFQSF